jgi:hypothetical protein
MISKLLIDYIQFQNLSINKTIPIRIDLPSRRPANIKKTQPVGNNNTYFFYLHNTKSEHISSCHQLPFRNSLPPSVYTSFPGLWPKACFGPAPAAGHHAIAANGIINHSSDLETPSI